MSPHDLTSIKHATATWGSNWLVVLFLRAGGRFGQKKNTGTSEMRSSSDDLSLPKAQGIPARAPRTGRRPWPASVEAKEGVGR